MRRFRPARRAVLTAVAAATLTPGASTAQLQDQTRLTPTNDLPNPYRSAWPWGEVPTGPYHERAAFIGVEEGPDGNLYVLHRCRGNSCTDRPEAPVMKLDPSGALLAAWGRGMFDFPHGFDVDDEGNVWATDQRGHQVFKWSANGGLLLTLGERRVAGDPPARLSEPTDVVVSPDGHVYVAEGHSFSQGVNRVSKFDANGSFLTSWGTTGSGGGQFNVPHTIALDSRGRVFVGDRANNRIQIFDPDGALLDVWYQFGRPSGIAITPDDRIYVADSESWGTDNPGWKKGIRVGSAVDGTVDFLIEDAEPYAIEHSGAEGVGVDSDGNVYGAVVRRRTLERHAPLEGGAAMPLFAEAGASIHLGHVVSGFGAAPGGRGLAVTATAEAGVALLHANFAAGDASDLDAVKRHALHVLHALEPTRRSRGPGAGYGLLRAVEDVATHLAMAAGAPGASESLVLHAAHVAAIARRVVERSRRAVDTAGRLLVAPSIRRAAPLVAELRLLLYRVAEGADIDGDGEIALGEAGLQQMEAHLYLILEGEGLMRALR